jgi:hypothetical protein
MRHAAHVAHRSRGRLRIRVPSAKGNPAALEAIRKSLASMSGVNDVVVNESIGSVTINYDPKHHADFEQHLAGDNSRQDVVAVCEPPRLKDLGEVDELIEHEAEFLAQHSHSAKVIVDWTKGLDNGIKRMTGNAVDLKVIAPLALAVGAFMELGITAATPVWLTLGLFSFNHFVNMHTDPMPNGISSPEENATQVPAGQGKQRLR